VAQGAPISGGPGDFVPESTIARIGALLAACSFLLPSCAKQSPQAPARRGGSRSPTWRRPGGQRESVRSANAVARGRATRPRARRQIRNARALEQLLGRSHSEEPAHSRSRSAGGAKSAFSSSFFSNAARSLRKASAYTTPCGTAHTVPVAFSGTLAGSLSPAHAN